MAPAPNDVRSMSAAEIVRLLDLKPHPEGGYFRETFRDPRGESGRAHATAIYYLLARGERVQADTSRDTIQPGAQR